MARAKIDQRLALARESLEHDSMVISCEHHLVEFTEDPSTDPANPIWLHDLFLAMEYLFQISA